jgi:hypothetical protein
MAESNKKSTQGATSGSGSNVNRPKTTGAADTPSGGLGSSGTTGGGTLAGASSPGSTGLGTDSTGFGSSTSSSRTSGTHEMSSTASRGEGDSTAHGLLGQMRTSASDTFQTVKSNTVAKLDEQKSTLSTGLMHVADNIRELGTNLSGTDQQDPLTRIAADYSETAAEKLRTAADYFNTHDISTMYRDVEGLARRNPAVFVGGAFALGLIAARFLKSSSPRTGQNFSGRSINTGSIGGGGNVSRINSARTTGVA